MNTVSPPNLNLSDSFYPPQTQTSLDTTKSINILNTHKQQPKKRIKRTLLSCIKSYCCFISSQFQQQLSCSQSVFLFTKQQLANQLIKLKQDKVEPILRPTTSNLKTLVLDLDQTLVYTTLHSRQCNFTYKIKIGNIDQEFFTTKRPGVQQFIKEVSKYYELIVFTAGVKQYAEKIVQFIDPNKHIKYILYRDHCTPFNKIALKNLKLLNRQLKNTILFDNNINSGLLQPDNLLLSHTYVGQQNDNELFRTVQFLKYLSNVQDVRNVQKHKQKFYSKKSNEKQNQVQVQSIVCLKKKSSSTQSLNNSNRQLPHIR